MSMNFLDAAGVLADSAQLPVNDLLAREARSIVQETVEVYDALAPDWSQAPEWAQWCTIDHDGRYSWYRDEPKWTSKEPGEWAYTQRARGEYVSLSLGIDWRLLKWQRPEVAA